MVDTILVPIDLAHAERAGEMIEKAKQLGGKKASILLMSVVEDVPAYVAAELPAGIFDERRQEAEKELGDIARNAGLSEPVRVHIGQPSPAILAVAEETGADVIIIASHKPGLQDYLLGSTAGRVVRHAKCSVLVLR